MYNKLVRNNKNKKKDFENRYDDDGSVKNMRIELKNRGCRI